MRFYFYFFAAVFLCVSMQTTASENLLSLYQKALQYDAQYKAKEANTEAEREEINKATAQFYPKLQLSANVGRGVTDRTTESLSGAADTHLNYNTQSYALSVRQPLFNQETMAAYKGAQAHVKSKEALLRKEHAGLIARIASAYIEALYAEKKVTVTQSNIDAMNQQLTQAERKYAQGQGTVTEISEAQANVEMAQAELLEAANLLENNQQMLSHMTGQHITALAKLNPERLPSAMPVAENLDYWLETALNNNPEISAAQYMLTLSTQEIEKKQAGHYPTLDLVGARSYSENDSNNTIGSSFNTTTVALQLNVPLYACGYVSANVRQAQDRLIAAEAELNFATRETQANIRKYFNRLRSELLTMKAYEQAVKFNETALIGTQKGFVAGLRTNIEVLNAQQKLYVSQLELSKSQFMLVNDMVNIQQTAGILNEAQLQKINQFFW